MPDLGLPRLMLGSRTVDFLQDIAVGSTLHRRSEVRDLRHKSNASGPMAIVSLAHTLSLAPQGEPALIETQTYLLMPARSAPAPAPAAPPQPPAPLPPALRSRGVRADATLLFQYSALGQNSHKIHLDRRHAQEVEGFPDLVVNGGLATLWLTEFLRTDLGVSPRKLSARHLAPLYCDRAITLTADREESGWRLRAYDDRQVLAVDMEVTPR